MGNPLKTTIPCAGSTVWVNIHTICFNLHNNANAESIFTITLKFYLDKIVIKNRRRNYFQIRMRFRLDY